MTDSLFNSPETPDAQNLEPDQARKPASRPDLPEPRRARWQPLRIGLVELFRYDSEEFWFRDGHLLLRGNNGTGKTSLAHVIAETTKATFVEVSAIGGTVSDLRREIDAAKHADLLASIKAEL